MLNPTLKILIIDEVESLLISGLISANFEVDYLPQLSKEEIYKCISDYEGLIVRSKILLTKELLLEAKKLKFIARAGSGMDNIDLEFATARKINCIHAGEANADAVGEHTIGMLLMLLNNLAIADKEVRNKIWEREANRGTELSGKTIGIIGYGNTGKSLAKKLNGFDVKVLAYDKYLQNYSDSNATEASMNEIYENAEIISFHIPLTNETRMMVDEKFLKNFSKKICLLNLCRGKILKLSALIEGIKAGKIIGAALDVLENEKLSTLNEQQQTDFDFLIDSKKVVFSPHIAGWTFESYRKISELLLEKITNLELSK